MIRQEHLNEKEWNLLIKENNTERALETTGMLLTGGILLTTNVSQQGKYQQSDRI